MKKRTVTMLLAASLAVSVLAGCGSSGSTSDETQAEEQTEEEEAESESEAEETEDDAAAESEEGEDAADAEALSADEAIVSAVALGRVEADGSKPYAIALEYSVDLTGAEVSADTYEVWDYWLDQTDGLEKGENPGAVTDVYVNDEAAVSESGGTGTGNYVILELNTDFQVSQGSAYYASMAFSVLQTADIEADSATVTAGTEAVVNYENASVAMSIGGVDFEIETVMAQEGTYSIEEVDRYTIGVYSAEDCFEEASGEYVDLDLDYALYVPEDYDDSLQYMLVLHIEDAGSLGDDAMLVLTEGQTPVNLISDEMQQFAKDQGYGGVIVVCPQITYEYRTARDNYSVSAALQATWKLLDSITDEYNIDMDRVYGTGQSMGGMQVLEMAAQRDNYFAAVLSVGCQWGSNFNKEDEYQGASYYATPVDDVYVLSTDAQGNPCDYQNWYYMLSDDNILSLNCTDDSFSTTAWTEFSLLYSDLAGVEIPRAFWNPLTTDLEEQNANLEALLAEENETGIYWASFEGGSHMATWIYADQIDAIYEWLLSQTASSETERGKITTLANDFVLAEEQLETEDRLIGTNEETGESFYFVTGKAGAGTAGYNSGLYTEDGGEPVRMPGWTADAE